MNGPFAGAAVVGVPEDIIVFIDSGSCISNASAVRRATTNAEIKAKLSVQIGHEIDFATYTYSVGRVSVPSGESTPEGSIKAATDALLEQEDISPQILPFNQLNPNSGMLRYYPGGLVYIDPETVISPSPVDIYEVYPSFAGLTQLVGEGKLRREGEEYFILAEIPNYPSSMGGAHAVKFVLAEGLPIPEGYIGHSTLRREGSDECIRGPRCKQ